MKFLYKPISLVIADIRAELPRRDRAGIINDTDCLNYIIEVMREVGGSNYDTKPLVIKMCKGTAVLPEEFYKVDKIWLASAGMADIWQQIGNSTIWFTKEVGCYYNASNILYPGDSFTAHRYCTSGMVNNVTTRPTYIIRSPNIIRCSLQDATIAMEYLCLPRDDKGNYLIQDEIYTLKAAKAFTSLKLLYEDYIDQRVPRYVYKDLQEEYDVNVTQAQAIFKYLDPADDVARGQIQDHRYDMFKFD